MFTESGAITADADTIVEVDVQRFDLDTSGVVVLAAQVAVERSRRGRALAARAAPLHRAPGLGLDRRSGRRHERGARPPRGCDGGDATDRPEVSGAPERAVPAVL